MTVEVDRDCLNDKLTSIKRLDNVSMEIALVLGEQLYSIVNSIITYANRSRVSM